MITNAQVSAAYKYAYAMQRIHKFFDEDIIQEGMLRFVEVMNRQGQFHLALVALKNRILDCLKASKSRLKYVGTTLELDEEMAAAGLIVETSLLDDLVLLKQIYVLINEGCNQKQREVIHEYLNGSTFEEIGKKFGLDKSAIKQRFDRAIKKIQKKV